MRSALVLAAGFLLGATAVLFLYAEPGATAFFTASPSACLNGTAQALISPGTADELTAFLASAQQSIDVEMYVFTSSELKDALVQAAGRGVRVRLILEPRIDNNLATAEFLASKGVEVRWATTDYANTHSKLAIVDGKKILVGSINWSRHALYENRETALIVENERLAREFLAAFEQDWAQASTAK
ncbi:MAG: phospholipase D-like domain-containing protein [Candidatus Micrarchaeota archaeon]